MAITLLRNDPRNMDYFGTFNHVDDALRVGVARIMSRVAGVQDWLVSTDAFMNALIPPRDREIYQQANLRGMLCSFSGYRSERELLVRAAVDDYAVSTYARIGSGSACGVPYVGREDPVELTPLNDPSGQITEVSNRLAELKRDFIDICEALYWLDRNAKGLKYVRTYLPAIETLLQLGAASEHSAINGSKWTQIRKAAPLTDDHPFVPHNIRKAFDRFSGIVMAASLLSSDDEHDIRRKANNTSQRLYDTPSVAMFSLPPFYLSETVPTRMVINALRKL